MQPNNHPDARNPGDTGGEAIPVPIPNTEVKLSSAEDTEGAAPREHRSSPGSSLLSGASTAPSTLMIDAAQYPSGP